VCFTLSCVPPVAPVAPMARCMPPVPPLSCVPPVARIQSGACRSEQGRALEHGITSSDSLTDTHAFKVANLACLHCLGYLIHQFQAAMPGLFARPRQHCPSIQSGTPGRVCAASATLPVDPGGTPGRVCIAPAHNPPPGTHCPYSRPLSL